MVRKNRDQRFFSFQLSAILAIPLSETSDCELAKIKMRATTKRRHHIQSIVQLRQRSKSSCTCGNLGSWTKMLKDDWMVLFCLFN